jgi:cytochrome c556
MRRRARFLSAAAGATVLLTVVLYAASPEDGHAAFQRREDTMKHLGIGRVVKGTAAYGPDAVTAAVTVASLASTLDRTLVPPGSDVVESKIKLEIFFANDHVDQLIAAVKAATARLVPVVESGDTATITAACTAV